MIISENKDVNSILVIRLDEIGDVVLTTPFLRKLKRNFPEAWITLVVKPQTFNLVELCLHVNEVVIFNWSGPKYIRRIQSYIRAKWLFYTNLKNRQYDMVIVPRWDADSYYASKMAYFSNANIRVGYSEKVNDNKSKIITDMMVI